jgi:hypothetical protein
MFLKFLLDPRFLGVVLFCCLEVAAGWALHHRGYIAGQAASRNDLLEYRLQVEQDALREASQRDTKRLAMEAENLKVTENYVSLQTATATAVRALDADRMRLQATLSAYRRATSTDPQAGLQVDDSALVGSFSECIDRYSSLAKESDEASDTLKSLQEYVTGVVEQQAK